MIGIEAIWLATEQIDMRAGIDTILARVVKVFGAARYAADHRRRDCFAI